MNLTAFHGLWLAIQVRTKRELATAGLLATKGYEHFVPLYLPARKSVHRAAKVPLFPGYIFCRFDSQLREPIVTTPGVLRIVGNSVSPLPVDEHEIESLKIVCGSGFRAKPIPLPEVGAPVIIRDGPLKGVRGSIMSHRKGFRLVISISMMHRSVLVESQASDIIPMDSAGTTFEFGDCAFRDNSAEIASRPAN